MGSTNHLFVLLQTLPTCTTPAPCRMFIMAQPMNIVFCVHSPSTALWAFAQEVSSTNLQGRNKGHLEGDGMDPWHFPLNKFFLPPSHLIKVTPLFPLIPFAGLFPSCHSPFLCLVSFSLAASSSGLLSPVTAQSQAPQLCLRKFSTGTLWLCV